MGLYQAIHIHSNRLLHRLVSGYDAFHRELVTALASNERLLTGRTGTYIHFYLIYRYMDEEANIEYCGYVAHDITSDNLQYVIYMYTPLIIRQFEQYEVLYGTQQLNLQLSTLTDEPKSINIALPDRLRAKMIASNYLLGLPTVDDLIQPTIVDNDELAPILRRTVRLTECGIPYYLLSEAALQNSNREPIPAVELVRIDCKAENDVNSKVERCIFILRPFLFARDPDGRTYLSPFNYIWYTDGEQVATPSQAEELERMYRTRNGAPPKSIPLTMQQKLERSMPFFSIALDLCAEVEKLDSESAILDGKIYRRASFNDAMAKVTESRRHLCTQLLVNYYCRKEWGSLPPEILEKVGPMALQLTHTCQLFEHLDIDYAELLIEKYAKKEEDSKKVNAVYLSLSLK